MQAKWFLIFQGACAIYRHSASGYLQKTNCMENFQTHINPLLKLSVSELEQMAYALYEANSFNKYTHLIRDCLWERRNKLNARFEFTQ